MKEAAKPLAESGEKVKFTERELMRFWSKVDKRQTDECWPWTASTLISGGYGQLYMRGKPRRAHVLSWIIAHGGDMPRQNLCILHSCDNPICVNPSHLWLGTQLENIRDMNNKGRHGCGGVKGERHGRAVLSEKDVIEIRNRYSPRKISQYKLAREYKVSRSCIMFIVSRRNWNHLS